MGHGLTADCSPSDRGPFAGLSESRIIQGVPETFLELFAWDHLRSFNFFVDTVCKRKAPKIPGSI